MGTTVPAGVTAIFWYAAQSKPLFVVYIILLAQDPSNSGTQADLVRAGKNKKQTNTETSC